MSFPLSGRFGGLWTACALVSVSFWASELLLPALGEPKPKRPKDANTSSPITLVDVTGDIHHLAHSPGCRAVVAVFLSTECPISNSYLPALNRCTTGWRKAGVELYGVVSDPNVTRTEAAAHRKEYGIRFPVLFDGSGELRHRLQPTHTPEAFVLNREFQVLYRGGIDDRYAGLGQKKTRTDRQYLAEAVDATLAGKPVPLARTEPIGCLLEATAGGDDGAVTYCRDIAPILLAHCIVCHRDGGSAPFSLTSYDDVAKRARQVGLVTHSRFMPPWKPAPDFGRFDENRRLSEREIASLAAWAEAGAPRGDEANLPPQPTYSNGWALGTPDLILEMPEAFDVPADGDDLHRHFVLPTGMKENRLISALEFRAGNPRVVHHASFYLDTTGAARRLDDADPGLGYGGGGGAGFWTTGTLRSWLPGFVAKHLPKGTGRLINKGSDLVIEIHYHPSGKKERDRSSVGLYFAPRSAKQLVEEVQVLNLDLEIPAGAKRHHHRAEFTLPADITMLDCAPHMHLLGREMKATATLPDGRVEPLIWIKDWNYRWQGQYLYADPVRLPKGTRIEVDAWYDNSSGNPLNPHSPPQTVRWGEQTNDEMGIFHFQYTCESLGDMATVNRAYQTYLLQQHVALGKSYQSRGGEESIGGP